MGELAFVNGVFGPIDEARVSIEDRGFQFGDGIYEVIFAYGGRPFLLAAHLARFRRSAAAVGIRYDFDGAPLEPIIAEGLRRSGFTEAMVYMQITRGVAPRSHAIPEHLRPTLVMTFKPRPSVPDDLLRRGARVMTTPDTRWANCSVKAVTLLPNVLAKDEARRRGFDEAVFVGTGGEVRECTSSNIFMVRGGRLMTPTRTRAVLHGVTQAFLFDCAASIGVEVTECLFDVATMLAADEVFLSSTAVEVLGVTVVDDATIGDGQVGALTRKLHAEFRRRVAVESEE